MTRTAIFCALAISFGLAAPATAQVKTDVPPLEAGAKPVTVEHRELSAFCIRARESMIGGQATQPSNLAEMLFGIER